MVPDIRQHFNDNFTEAKYEAFLHTLQDIFGESPTFKVAETPVFIPLDLKKKLVDTCDEISSFVCQPDFRHLMDRAIPLPSLLVPAEDQHTLFLQYDFAIGRTPEGELVPNLIELQGFPSLYMYQHLLAQSYRRHYDIPDGYDHLFSGLTSETYLQLMREVIIGDHDPRNVILLDIEPEKQNTRIDFWGTQRVLGIKVLCLSKLKRDGRRLFYLDEQGNKVPVYRIFNRVIFDELIQRDDLPREFNLTEEVDVEWAGHPNWFMRISKYSMPFLKGTHIPESFFLSELDRYPDDLENFVLKPLFSFSGKGVKIRVTPADLDQISDRDNYILQRRVEYTPLVVAPGNQAPSKCEIRMMMVWKNEWERPRLVINLVRLTHGEMVGVRYNKEDRWVGATVAFFEND